MCMSGESVLCMLLDWSLHFPITFEYIVRWLILYEMISLAGAGLSWIMPRVKRTIFTHGEN